MADKELEDARAETRRELEAFFNPKVEIIISNGQEWYRRETSSLSYIEHLNDVEWFDSKRPRRWHRCKAQSRGWVGLSYVERCACGAYNDSARHPYWIERNSRTR